MMLMVLANKTKSSIVVLTTSLLYSMQSTKRGGKQISGKFMKSYSNPMIKK